MNHLQIIAFLVYVFSTLLTGIGAYLFINRQDKDFINRGVFLGEVLLLGNLILGGELILLSVLHLYYLPMIWGVVLLQLTLIFDKRIRTQVFRLFTRSYFKDIPTILFIGLLAFFAFRNSYFCVDVDSHSAYLYAQKIWLSRGTSIFTEPMLDSRIYVPHVEVIPCALGIALFGKGLIFCQYINLLWRVIALFLVFGYVSFRYTTYHGLAASILLLFNDHFFFSGANQWVTLNAAIIACLFAVAYNLWEARRVNSSFRFLLAVIFLPQLMANKYQMFYALVVILAAMPFIVPGFFAMMKELFRNRYSLTGVVVSIVFGLLWYLKNFVATGVLTFPVLAGNFGVLGWTRDMSDSFMHVFRGLTPTEFLKYASYFFVWPGIHAGKIVGLTFSFLPVIFIGLNFCKKFDKEEFFELCYWLFLAFFITFAICLASHQDPRYYRFPIGIYAFIAVMVLHILLTVFMRIRNKILVGLIIIVLSLPGYKIVFSHHDNFKRPSMQDNLNVLLNKIHLKDVLERHYPSTDIVLKQIKENPGKFMQSAWSRQGTVHFSPFLLPERPQAILWHSTLIHWDSYGSEEGIIKDLKDNNIKWIMVPNAKGLEFLPVEEYAKIAVKYDRYPKTIYYPYDLPPELTRTNFKWEK